MVLNLHKLDSPSPRDALWRMLCAKFCWNWPSGSREEDFKILTMYFHYFVIISPWKNVGPFICKKKPRPPFSQGWIESSLVEIGSVVLEMKIFKFRQCYLPLVKSMVIHLKKLESPSPKDAFCQVWLKLAQWFWRMFLNFINVFFSILWLSLLWKMWGPSFEQYWILFTQGCIVPSLVKSAQWFWRRRLLNLVNVFLLFRYYLPSWINVGPSFRKLEFSSPKDALCKVGWNWLSGSEENFLIFVNVFSLFRNYLNLDIGWGP